MGKQPAAIIIVRHGTRLDQADKNWRATAEHPYDPPLSYGGWIQCQTLGARIDRELQSLDKQVTPDDLEREDNGLETQRPKKKRKIIIHSSPYKRCIQTSIAIAAGLRYPQPDRVQRPVLTPYQRASISKPVQPDQSRASISSNGDSAQLPVNNDKLELKVDPYLAEWLSPSYFEDSKVPPSADLIMERAKETLQRPLQEIRGADLAAFVSVAESPTAEDLEKENIFGKSLTGEKGGLRGMAVAGHSLPHRTRATSFGRDMNNGTSQLNLLKTRQRARTTAYSPPVPQYSLAPQDPIPAGFVAHARDFCVEPDLDWDSEKLGWGDAGAYPEEWATMHVRFRQGLQKTLSHYSIYKPLHTIDESMEENDDDSDNDNTTDLVLVLVTHQAGANALIRLMTGAPALHDVGVASLTLAVRRPILRRPPSLSGTSHSPLGYDRENRRNSRRGSLDLGLADDFEMRIIASTEHLRYGSNPLGLNSPRLGRSPAIAGRKMVGADSLEGFSIGDPLAWRSNSSGNGITRVSSQRGRTNVNASDSSTNFFSSRPVINTGLWGSPAISAAARDPIEESIEELPPMSPKSRPITPVESDRSIPESQLKLDSPGGRSRSSTVQSTGLWGSNNPVVSNGIGRSTLGESFGSGSGGGGLGIVTGGGGSGIGGTWGSTVGAGGSIARARSPAKRRWTAVTNSP